MKIVIPSRFPWAVFWGVATTLLWSFTLCLWSALNGPNYSVGVSKVIVIGHWRFGAIYHYWDPMILGLVVAFMVWSCRHAIPNQKKGDYVGGILLLLAGLAVTTTFLKWFSEFFGGGVTGAIISFSVIILIISVIFPFDFKVPLLVSSSVSIPCWYLSPAFWLMVLVLFLFAKWAIWWIVNTTRYGAGGAWTKLKESRRNGDGAKLDIPGTPTGHGIVHADISDARVCEP